MPNLVSNMICEELSSEFDGVEGMVLVAFGGLSVEETENLRGELAEKGARFRMIRNKLARRVLSEKGYEFPDDVLIGNTAVAYGSAEETIAAAKILSSPAVKKAGKVKFKAGMLESRVLDGKDALQLAQIPDSDTLRAQLLGVISGPARSLVCTLNAVGGGLARVIQAHADEGEEGE
jgi:large subunit ribosomal protein L10